MSHQYPLPTHDSLLTALTEKRNTDSEIYSGRCNHGVAFGSARGWTWLVLTVFGPFYGYHMPCRINKLSGKLHAI